MPLPAPSRRPSRPAGFTLIELLTVISIIAVLATILVATIAKVKNSASTQQSIALFGQIAESMERYRLDTHHYPVFYTELGITAPTAATNDVMFKLNADKGFFYQVMIGQQPAGANTYNPKKNAYLQLNDNSLLTTAPGTPAAPNIQDAFGNTDIAVVINLSATATITAGDLESQSVLCAQDGTAGTPVVVRNLPQRIAIYSKAPAGASAVPFITNWVYNSYSQ